MSSIKFLYELGDLVEEILGDTCKQGKKDAEIAGIFQNIPGRKILLTEILFEVKKLRKYLKNT